MCATSQLQHKIKASLEHLTSIINSTCVRTLSEASRVGVLFIFIFFLSSRWFRSVTLDRETKFFTCVHCLGSNTYFLKPCVTDLFSYSLKSINTWRALFMHTTSVTRASKKIVENFENAQLFVSCKVQVFFF